MTTISVDTITAVALALKTSSESSSLLATTSIIAESGKLLPSEGATEGPFQSVSSVETIFFCVAECDETDQTGEGTYVGILAQERPRFTTEELSELPQLYLVEETVTLVTIEAVTFDAPMADEVTALVTIEGKSIEIIEVEYAILTATTEENDLDLYILPFHPEEEILGCSETAHVESSDEDDPANSVIWVDADRRERFKVDEIIFGEADINLPEIVTLVPIEQLLSPFLIETTPEVALLKVSSSGYTSILHTETVKLKFVEGKSAVVTFAPINEQIRIKISETSHKVIEGISYLTHHETVYLEPPEELVATAYHEGYATILLDSIEFSDANFVFDHPIVPVVDYTFEVRRRNANGIYDLLGIIENRIEPTISSEVGIADELKFTMPLADSKYRLFTGNRIGLEIWYYGRDNKLKQVFSVQKVEPSRNYGSGSGKAGENISITADGPESYLNIYQVRNEYKVTKKRPFDILYDITASIRADGLINAIEVDATLNKPIDIDISWENLQAAIGRITDQTGGHLQVLANADDPNKRTLRITTSYERSAWTGWSDMGGICTATPAAISQVDGKINVFVRGGDGGLWGKYYTDGAWLPAWNGLGGVLLQGTGPAAASWSENRMDIIVVGTDKSVWQKAWQSAWGNWQSLGGVITSTPAAISRGVNLLEIYGRGTDGALWHKGWTSGTWSGWENLGGAILPGTGPAVASLSLSHEDVYVIGTDNQVWHRGWNGSAWTAWGSLGGQSTASPAAIAYRPGNRVYVFVRGNDGSLFYKVFANGAWGSTWTNLSGGLKEGTGPALSMWSTGRLDVFIVHPSGALLQKTRTSMLSTKQGHLGEEEDSWSEWVDVSNFAVEPTPDPIVPIISYDVFPSLGNRIQNNGGSGGSDFEAFAFNNDYTKLKSGITAWKFNEVEEITDYIKIPTGRTIANLTDVTISMLVYIGTQKVANARLISKAQEYGAFELIYDSTNKRIVLTRGTTNSDSDVWATATNSVPENDWYYMQLIWASGSAPDPYKVPVLILDQEQIEFENITSGSGLWSNDFYHDVFIGNTEGLDGTGDFVGTISVFRLYDKLHGDSMVDYNRDAWRREHAENDAQIFFDEWPQPGVPIPAGVM